MSLYEKFDLLLQAIGLIIDIITRLLRRRKKGKKSNKKQPTLSYCETAGWANVRVIGYQTVGQDACRVVPFIYNYIITI